MKMFFFIFFLFCAGVIFFLHLELIFLRKYDWKQMKYTSIHIREWVIFIVEDLTVTLKCRQQYNIYMYGTYDILNISVHKELYSIQQFVIKFVSDLRQVGDFLRVFRFLPPIKLTATK
jgi:hypothetical protein